eukprot:scaffold86509_cov52-Phaeocystis_antarctica.AAC.2
MTHNPAHDDGDMATVAPSGLRARLVRHVRRVSPPLMPALRPLRRHADMSSFFKEMYVGVYFHLSIPTSPAGSSVIPSQKVDVEQA